jgi:hypothetical protein
MGPKYFYWGKVSAYCGAAECWFTLKPADVYRVFKYVRPLGFKVQRFELANTTL